MKTVRLEKGYYYLPENNFLVNQETLDKFGTYFENHKLELYDLNVDEHFLRRQLKNTPRIILGITESCNLRCKYCVYNDNYLYENNLSGRNLDFRTAKKGLEYICEYIKDRFDKSFNIGFYGGEPFIKFDLIKKIVTYSKTLFKDWQLSFGATTNATLLTDKIIEFLVAEDFNITISLDGPPKNHNAKRVYNNGKETFTDVWNAIKRIKNRDPEYFNKKISFNMVYSRDQSLLEMFDFFVENELVNANRVKYSQVVGKDTDYYEKIDYNAKENRRDYRTIFAKIKTKHKDSTKLKPIEKLFHENYFVNKNFNSRPKSFFSGICLFDSRIFLDVEGKFHVCESINNRFSVGDVWRGFDLRRMVEIVKEFENIKKNHCSDCDIKYLCKPCYVMFASDGTLELDKDFCSASKKSVIKDLRRQIRFEEYKRTINEKDKSKIFQFHQFITIVKGPVNAAIADFINGDIYHVPTKVVEHFENREYEKIPEFIKAAKDSGLIISINNSTWIPKQNLSIDELKNFDVIGQNEIVLCVEDGVDLSLVKRQLYYFNITQIIFYGPNSRSIEGLFPGIEILYENPDYQKCSNLSVIKKNDFVKTEEDVYNFNRICNNCWGHKISITKDGKIRPCIYSNMIIGELENLNNRETVEKIKSYWYITKDKVEKCKECELRYFCIDCREMAQRESNGDLHATNPSCKYNPHTGVWQDDE